MSLLRWLRSLFVPGAGTSPDAAALIFHVRCDACGEIVRIRADRRFDLVEEFDDGVTGYSLHKDVLGTQCHRLMRMHVSFDRGYTIRSQAVEGGRFVTPAL